MIMDDIYTTGATIERAKEMLHVNGVKEDLFHWQDNNQKYICKNK